MRGGRGAGRPPSSPPRRANRPEGGLGFEAVGERGGALHAAAGVLVEASQRGGREAERGPADRASLEAGIEDRLADVERRYAREPAEDERPSARRRRRARAPGPRLGGVEEGPRSPVVSPPTSAPPPSAGERLPAAEAQHAEVAARADRALGRAWRRAPARRRRRARRPRRAGAAEASRTGSATPKRFATTSAAASLERQLRGALRGRPGPSSSTSTRRTRRPAATAAAGTEKQM